MAQDNSTHQLNTQRGFSFLEVLVTLAVTTILAAGIASLLSQVSQVGKKSSLMSNLRFELERFLGAVRSTPGWDATINDGVNNPLLDCLRNTPALPNPNCIATLNPPPPLPPAVPPAPTTFIQTLYNPNGIGVIYERISSDPNIKNGFTNEGIPCHLANASLPDSNCPIGLQFWIYHNSCAGAPCLQPPVMIETFLTTFNSASTPRINFDNYRFRVSKTGVTDLGQLCTSLHGTLDPGPPVKCNFNQNSCEDLNGDGSKDSPIAAYMVGFDTDWSVLCSTSQCPVNEVVVGVNAIGNPRCGPPPTGAAMCLVNQLMVGVSRNPATGSVTPLCTLDTVPLASGTQCSPGYAPTGVDDRGRAVGCTRFAQDCGANKVLQTINPDGTKVCVDRGSGDSCTGENEFVRGINADGTVACGTVDYAKVADHLTLECIVKHSVAADFQTNQNVDCPATYPLLTGGGTKCEGGSGVDESYIPFTGNIECTSGDCLDEDASIGRRWVGACGGAPTKTHVYAICCRMNDQ